MPSPIDNPNRPRLVKLSDSGGIVFVHPCCKCGNKDAPFGYNNSPSGNINKPGEWKYIIWFCIACNPKEILTQTKLL